MSSFTNTDGVWLALGAVAVVGLASQARNGSAYTLANPRKEPLSYAEAADLWARARDKKKGKPLPGRSVWLTKKGDDYVVRLYDTDLVTVRPDGTWVLSSGGHNTPTTRRHLEEYAPVYVRSLGKALRVRPPGGGDEVLFFDGIVVDERGQVVNPLPQAQVRQLEVKKDRLDGMIRDFLAETGRAIDVGQGDLDWPNDFQPSFRFTPNQGSPEEVAELYSILVNRNVTSDFLYAALIEDGMGDDERKRQWAEKRTDRMWRDGFGGHWRSYLDRAVRSYFTKRWAELLALTPNRLSIRG